MLSVGIGNGRKDTTMDWVVVAVSACTMSIHDASGPTTEHIAWTVKPMVGRAANSEMVLGPSKSVTVETNISIEKKSGSNISTQRRLDHFPYL